MSRIMLKFRDMELEFDGSEEFIRDELPEMFNNFTKLIGTQKNNYSTGNEIPDTDKESKKLSISIQGTTNQIATKLKATSSAELTLASLVKLHFVNGIDVASRKDILNEMKSATSFYQQSYSKNLTQSLNNLMKSGRINEISKGNYSLSKQTIDSVEGKLV